MRHLYDCHTVNPGDVAIGSVMKSFLGLPQGGPESKDDDLFVIGGGHLIQSHSEEYYRGFRRKGHHVLYSVGVSGGCGAIKYLNEYRFVSVRTYQDRRVLRRGLKRNVEVVPCPANLLPIEDSDFDASGKIGIQVFYPGYPRAYVELLQRYKGEVLAFPWRRSIRNNTVDDLIAANEVADGLDGEVVPTDLSPGQLRDVIRQLDFFVCQSLHAAMWAYQSNANFAVHNYAPKIMFWASERNLENRVFRRPDQLPDMIPRLMKSKHVFEGERDQELAQDGLERVAKIVG